MKTFLMTYRSWLKPSELMEKLILRYCVTPPYTYSLDLSLLKNQKQMPIRLRCASILLESTLFSVAFNLALLLSSSFSLSSPPPLSFLFQLLLICLRRVLKVLKYWVDKYFDIDFLPDASLQKFLRDFVENTVAITGNLSILLP